MEYPTGFSSELHARKPICGVLSLAICAEVSYEVARATMKANMAAHRRRFGGRTSDSQRERAMRALAVKFDRVEVQGSISLNEFCLKVMKPGITYMVSSKGHVVTVRDGRVVDQRENVHHWLISKNVRMRIVRYWIMNGKGW